MAAMAFVLDYAVAIHRQHGDSPWANTSLLFHACIAALLFTMTAPVAALAWRVLLEPLGYSITFRAASATLFRTQIAKYIPGNVGHHIGRVALAKAQLQIPATKTITSLLQESGLVVLCTAVAGALLVSIGAPGPRLPTLGYGLSLASISLLACVAVSLAILLCHFITNSAARRLPAWSVSVLGLVPPPKVAAVALTLYLAMNLFNCAAVTVVASALLELDTFAVLALGGAYLLSWSVGFLLPGAPGGLGVREASFLILLDGLYPPDTLLALTVALRGATVLADVIIFAAGAALSCRVKHNSVSAP